MIKIENSFKLKTGYLLPTITDNVSMITYHLTSVQGSLIHQNKEICWMNLARDQSTST